MFDILFESGLAIYGLLILIAALLLYQYKQTERRGYLKAVGVVGLIALALFLLDRLVETDKEKALKTLDEVTALINEGKHDQAFSFLSDDFRAYDMDRNAMKDAGKRALERFSVRNIRPKSLSVEKQDREKRVVTLRFNATADSSFSDGWAMAPCEVDFVVDGQGRCRVKSFRVYQPFVDSLTPWNPFTH